MVTAVANVLDLGGASLNGAGVCNTGTGKGQSSGKSADGESMFAQLLEGMGESIQPLSTSAEALTAKDEVADISLQNQIPMLSEPIVVQIPVPTMTSNSANSAMSFTASGNVSPPLGMTGNSQAANSATSEPTMAVEMPVPEAPLVTVSPSLAASTSAATTPVPASVSDTAAGSPNMDLQWLRAMTGAARGKSETASPAVNVSTSRSANASTASLPSVMELAQGEAPQPGHDLDNTPSQTLIQMLAHTVAAAPVMAATLPRDDRAVAAPTDSLAGVTPTALQPAGTALAEVSALSMPVRQHLQAEVGTQAWAAELGNKLTMLATRDTQSATLYMIPADLGPVQVRIEMNNEQASVWFTAEHPETRSALEQALPRLREMFTAQGMSLTDAGVFGNRSQQQSQSQPHSPGSGNALAGSLFAGDEAIADTATVRSLSLSLLDTYA